MYEGQPILFMDEFKGGIRFQILLNLLDSYKVQLHCRYANSYALWTEVHISSIFPPEEAYRFMVDADTRKDDPAEQLLRRIDTIVYHYRKDDAYATYSMPAVEYKDYKQLQAYALNNGFMPVEVSPFN